MSVLKQLQRSKQKVVKEERAAVVRSSNALDEEIENEETATGQFLLGEGSLKSEPSWVRALTEPILDEEGSYVVPIADAKLSLKTSPTLDSPPWWLTEQPESNPQVEWLFVSALRILEGSGLAAAKERGWKFAVQEAVVRAVDSLKEEVRFSRRQLEQAEHLLYELIQAKGPLDPLFQDPQVSDIFVDSWDEVRVLRSGHAIDTPIRFLSKEVYQSFVNALLFSAQRELDKKYPVMDFAISDKWKTRANVVFSGLVESEQARVCFHIPRAQPISFFDILQTKTLPATVAAWLAELVAVSEANILIAGPEGSGKTVLANAMLSAVGSDERVVSIEKMPEISTPHVHIERLLLCGLGRANGNELTANDLIKAALRRSPHRIFVSDLDEEISAAFVSTIEGGCSGSIATVLASDAEEALWKLVDFSLSRSKSGTESMLRRISRAVNLVITLRNIEGTPCLSEIVEVIPAREKSVRLQPLVCFVGISNGKRKWQLVSKDSYWMQRLKEKGLSLVPGPGLMAPDDPIDDEVKQGKKV